MRRPRSPSCRPRLFLGNEISHRQAKELVLRSVHGSASSCRVGQASVSLVQASAVVGSVRFLDTPVPRGSRPGRGPLLRVAGVGATAEYLLTWSVAFVLRNCTSLVFLIVRVGCQLFLPALADPDQSPECGNFVPYPALIAQGSGCVGAAACSMESRWLRRIGTCRYIRPHRPSTVRAPWNLVAFRFLIGHPASVASPSASTLLPRTAASLRRTS